MIYLSSFLFSEETVSNPNIYPYNVFAGKNEKVLVFNSPITVLYGNNASGKSTMLNIMANRLGLEGQEYATSNKFGKTLYFSQFVEECSYTLGETEDGRSLKRLPQKSRYIKSEDILYEIKKIQQEQVLGDGYVYEHIRRGMPKEQWEYLGCQFIISTHSPFMLGTLRAKIYNLDSGELEEAKWTELENVRYFYDFFERHREEFQK